MHWCNWSIFSQRSLRYLPRRSRLQWTKMCLSKWVHKNRNKVSLNMQNRPVGGLEWTLLLMSSLWSNNERKMCLPKQLRPKFNKRKMRVIMPIKSVQISRKMRPVSFKPSVQNLNRRMCLSGWIIFEHEWCLWKSSSPANYLRCRILLWQFKRMRCLFLILQDLFKCSRLYFLLSKWICPS